MTEVAEVRGFDVTWHPVSLYIINEDKEDTVDHRASHYRGHQLSRVVEAARRAHGEDAVPALYTAFGSRLHPGGMTDVSQIVEESLVETGLDASLASAAEDASLDETLRENSNHALKIAGPDVGVPVISVNDVAFFGPVVTPAPTGETALQLWDGIVAAASVPGFYELKRGRTVGPQF